MADCKHKIGEAWGLDFCVDPDMPEDAVEFRDRRTGRVLLRLVGAGEPEPTRIPDAPWRKP